MRNYIIKIKSCAIVLAIVLTTGVCANAEVTPQVQVLDSSSSVNSTAIPDKASFETILAANIGSGDQEVSYSPEEPGIINEGPTSFAVGMGEKIFILDTLNKRIQVYSNSKLEKSIGISFCEYPRDIALSDEDIYILDDCNSIYRIDDSGSIKKIINLPTGIQAYQVKQISVNAFGDVSIQTLEGVIYQLTDNGKKKLGSTSVQLLNNSKDVTINVSDKKLIKISFAENKGGVDVIGTDLKGNTYIEVQDEVPNSLLVLHESTLRMINSSGNQVAFARIPLEEYYNFPLRFYNITKDGTVYIMAMMHDSVNIEKVTLGKTYITLQRTYPKQPTSDRIKETGGREE